MDLAFLNPLLHRPGPWASVYFDTSAATEDAAAVRHGQARDACDRLAALGAGAATCQAVYDRLLAAGTDDTGHAVFAADGEVVIDTPLSDPPPSPSLTSFAALPHLAPLLDYGEHDPTCLVAYVNREGADFELRGTHGRPRPVGEVTGQRWPLHKTATADWDELHHQYKVQGTWERNAARIAETLAEDARRAHAEMLVLAGDPRERRSVREQLPEDLRAVTVESDHGGRAAGARGELLDADVARARAEQGLDHTEEVLDRFRAGRIPAHGRMDAAEGVPALVDAAREHRIATLLVRAGGPDLHRDVWVGPDPDQVALRRSDSRYLGVPDPAPAPAEDALLRSAAATGAEVVPLPGGTGPSALPAGGLGALLRWPYPDGSVPGGGSRPER